MEEGKLLVRLRRLERGGQQHDERTHRDQAGDGALFFAIRWDE